MLSPRYRWEVAAPAPDSLKESLPAYHPLVVQLLYNRGYTSPATVHAFFDGADSRESDPFLLRGMAVAVERIERAARAGETVGVFGDYDTDGITAAAILSAALAQLNVRAVVRLPHRVDDGYGLTDRVIAELAAQGVTLLVTVDCGISAVEPVALAAQRGMDVIVTDHHQPPSELPAAQAIVNPWLAECTYPFKEFCGAGLAYKLARALFASAGLLADEETAELRALAAMATVADVVPLRGENRTIVVEGIAKLRRTDHAGLRALMQVAGVDQNAVDSGSIGFALAPRLNAAGRMAHPHLAYELLTARDHAHAQNLANRLQELNRERQRETKRLMSAARIQVAEQGQERLLWVEGNDWPAGIIGLVAGRIAEECGKPALAVAVGKAEAVGSCRSIPGYDIAAALAARGDLMRRHGGHPQAAGFAVASDRRADVRTALQADARGRLDAAATQPRLAIDCPVDATMMNLGVLDKINVLAPFGASNPEPRFVSRGLTVSERRVVGADHLKTTFAVGGGSISGIGFHMADRAPHIRQGQAVDVVYSLQENTWGGFSRLEFRLQDVQMAGHDHIA